MKLKRRHFLSYSALLGFCTFPSRRNARALSKPPQYPMCQTATGQGWTTLQVLLPDEGDYEFLTTDSLNRNYSPLNIRVLFQDRGCRLVRITYVGLPEGELFFLTVLHSQSLHQEIRTFETLNTDRMSGRIALVSCMNDHLHRATMWHRLAEKDPDIIFFLGDAVYADMNSLFHQEMADPVALRRRFIEAWTKLDFYYWPHLKPVLAMWDDHDYGANNAGVEYPFKREALENFNHFYGFDWGLVQGDSKGLFSKGPGLAFEWKAFGQVFLFLDNRSYRGTSRNETPCLFGTQQTDWIFERVRCSDQPLWLISGSQWFGGYLKKDSFEFKYRSSFDHFLYQLKKIGKPIRFISGDVHFSEVMRIEREVLGYETVEITSSAMHSATVPGWHRLHKNPRRLASAGRFNFVLLDLLRTAEPSSLLVSSYGDRERAYFQVWI